MGRLVRRRAFTLIELLVALAIVVIMAAWGYVSYANVRRNAQDSMAIAMADQVASNLSHYYAFVGSYPTGYPGQGAATWNQLVSALGWQYNELPPSQPSVFQSTNGFVVYTDATTYQIVFRANGGTGIIYCRDNNGLWSLAGWPTTNGPWTGCW